MAEVVDGKVLNKEEFPKLSGNGRLNPDEAVDVARGRVSRFEAALGALGESDFSKAQNLRMLSNRHNVLHRSSQSAHRSKTQRSSLRGQQTVQVLAQKRSEEEQLLQDAAARLARLRELEAGPPVCHPTRVGRANHGVEGKDGRHGSGTRCTRCGEDFFFFLQTMKANVSQCTILKKKKLLCQSDRGR